jgi:hypothetical protein
MLGFKYKSYYFLLIVPLVCYFFLFPDTVQNHLRFMSLHFFLFIILLFIYSVTTILRVTWRVQYIPLSNLNYHMLFYHNICSAWNTFNPYSAKCGLHTDSIGITWELVGTAEFSPPKTVTLEPALLQASQVFLCALNLQGTNLNMLTSVALLIFL